MSLVLCKQGVAGSSPATPTRTLRLSFLQLRRRSQSLIFHGFARSSLEQQRSFVGRSEPRTHLSVGELLEIPSTRRIRAKVVIHRKSLDFQNIGFQKSPL